MLRIALIALSLAVPGHLYANKELDPAQVIFHGFTMKRPLPDEFQPPLPTGIEFDIRVVVQDKKKILGFDTANVELKRFEGQLKTNLTPTSSWLKKTLISNDRRQIFMRIGTPILPQKGARFFWFEAVAPVYTGARLLNYDMTNLDVTKAVPFKKDGEKIQEVRIFRAGIYTRVELLMNFMQTQVAKVTFKDIDNTVLKAEQIEIKPGTSEQQNWFIYKVLTDTTKMSITAAYFGEVLKQFIPIKLKVPIWF